MPKKEGKSLFFVWMQEMGKSEVELKNGEDVQMRREGKRRERGPGSSYLGI